GSGGESCFYDWECTNWFPTECPESEIQERVCANVGTCTGTIGMPNQVQTCNYIGPTEPLFDIFLTLPDKYKEICAGNKIKADIRLENYGKVELLDAFMTYWILDENNTLITELKDTRSVTNDKEFEIELKLHEEVPQGTYRLYAQITYSGNKTAVAGESFGVIAKEDCKLYSRLGSELYSSIKNYVLENKTYFIYGAGAFVVLLFVLILIKLVKTKLKIKKKKARKTRGLVGYKSKIKQNLKKINKSLKNKTTVAIILGISLLGILGIAKKSITGFVVNNLINKSLGTISVFIFIIGVFGFLIFVSREKIAVISKKTKEKIKKKHNKNSLKDLIKKKVYTEDGVHIGKVEEVILRENKIDSLQIKLDKKKKFKVKGIIVKYRNIKDVGHIVIIDRVIEEFL
ncbi:MAG TPA: PRC-barrel domain-containing protein, partial [Candidatus Paceibacterota bacterium]|nr:PRC-barrel domain-containing protein [Candidatus Paceibacterota bacterium]